MADVDNLAETPIEQDTRADGNYGQSPVSPAFGQVIMQKPKKPRSQAQIDATEKMLLAKKQRREQDLEIKREQDDKKLRLEEERTRIKRNWMKR
jgi:hypothetical protein